MIGNPLTRSPEVHLQRRPTVDDYDETADDDIEGILDDREDEVANAPASTGAKASAAKFIQLLVEEKGLALLKPPGAKLIEAVGRALESPLPISKKTEVVVDAIVSSPDVDELFMDDDKLAKLLKQW